MAPSVTTTQEIPTQEAVTGSIDLQNFSTRDVNELLSSPDAPKALTIIQPQGAHALACGLDAELDVTIEGHVGYYCAGMNQKATVTVTGNAGVGVAENMMSGRVHIKGDASQSAGATAHGGLLVIDGNAAARCGISMKGVDIVVGGDIGHMSAFMGQAGRLVVCGDAGEALGDSIYEARIYVRGTVASLGADCIKKEMQAEHLAELKDLLDSAGIDHDPNEFTRYGSARQLYNFHVDNVSAY
ncbi:protein glxC [Rhodococcus sp. ACPA4]|uniref:GltB/FmdC/FwdC-like GXGXG domain-containing protein n=1 Tax=Rhodococcus sp. ACPA4 TaxID=2028571 RepID=UPI000BB11C31|nr:protein glxC [Rhodococcus sp. ACPA4]PBC36034.1 protein glxC [Rhodococcus sp. ACPA4]